MKAEVLVDDEDFAWLNQWRWCDAGGYAMRIKTKNGKRTSIRMSRLILGLESGDPREADHKNRNTRDNRRSNLRIVTHAGNMQNQAKRPKTSRHRGVCFHKRSGKWVAQVCVKGRVIWLGGFDNEEDAAKAALEGRKKHQSKSLD